MVPLPVSLGQYKLTKGILTEHGDPSKGYVGSSNFYLKSLGVYKTVESDHFLEFLNFTWGIESEKKKKRKHCQSGRTTSKKKGEKITIARI